MLKCSQIHFTRVIFPNRSCSYRNLFPCYSTFQRFVVYRMKSRCRLENFRKVKELDEYLQRHRNYDYALLNKCFFIKSVSLSVSSVYWRLLLDVGLPEFALDIPLIHNYLFIYGTNLNCILKLPIFKIKKETKQFLAIHS